MNNNILICINEKIYCKILSRNFVEYGINSEMSPDNEDMIIRKLCEKKYNAVIISGLGDVGKKSGFIGRINNLFPDTPIAVMVYNSLCGDCRKFISAGAERCIIMPQSVSDVCYCVMNMMNDTELYLQETADFMTGYGFPCNMNGFYYFCSATEVCIMNYSEKVSEIYRIVAERFSTTPEIVESSIRHFIKVSYDKGVIGNFFNGMDSRPSNYELIRFASKAMTEFYRIFNNDTASGKDNNGRTRLFVYSSRNIFLNLKCIFN